MKADSELIIELLNSDVSNYRISKDTGLGVATISDLRNKKSKIERLGLETAAKLTEYAHKQKEMEKMKNKRWVVSLNGKLSIVDFDGKERIENPKRVTSPHKNDYPEPKLNNIIIDEVELTPEIREFEKVADKINRLAASKKQEVWYEDYNELKTVALKSVGYDEK